MGKLNKFNKYFDSTLVKLEQLLRKSDCKSEITYFSFWFSEKTVTLGSFTRSITNRMFCKLDLDQVETRKHSLSILIYDNGLYNNWRLGKSVLELTSICAVSVKKFCVA